MRVAGTLLLYIATYFYVSWLIRRSPAPALQEALIPVGEAILRTARRLRGRRP